MPCSRMHPESYDKEGIIILGDAWNIRHPITGGGMSVALSDVVLLTKLFSPLSFESSKEIHNVIKKQFFTQRVKRVAATNILAEAIYQVFAGRGKNYIFKLYISNLLIFKLAHMKAMQQAIFSYFKLGPKATNTPVRLLACMETSPMRLMYHFFVVALYGSVQIMAKSPFSFITAIRVIYTAATFFIPLLFHEHVASPKYILAKE